jgi:hypothetical protein
MRIAIVGKSKLNLYENRAIRNTMIAMLEKYPKDTVIVSGGAWGVDTIAEMVALDLGLTTLVYKPKRKTEEFFLKRNLEIANICDELICFTIPFIKIKCYHHDTPQDHEKTAGCWTLKKALELNKKTELIIVPTGSTV